ncbi:MAG TPA: hypothetical protein VEY30_10720 [Myxococcaceae bacterium]|nr:hypothetical protein [Myxococcaceae bacterium]
MVVVALITVRASALSAFRAFEAQAAQIMARHGGAIERTLVLNPGPEDGLIKEMHWVSFPDSAAFEAYRQDRDLARFLHLRDGSVLETQLWTGEPGPTYR